MSQAYDAIVVGAGVIGSSIACHLASDGLRVAILDKKGPFAAASGASDGAVSISSKKNGLMTMLGLSSIEYCKELSRSGSLLEKVFHQRPSYFFSTSPEENQALDVLKNRLGELDSFVHVASDQAGAEAIFKAPSCIQRVLHISGEGHMLGYEAVSAFLEAARIDRFWPLELNDFEEKDGYVSLATSQGEFQTAQLILATGVAAKAHFEDLPILPRSGQIIVTERQNGPPLFDGALTSAAYLIDKNSQGQSRSRPPIVLDPLKTNQLLIGSSREQFGSEESTDFQTIQRLLKHAVECYAPLSQMRILRVFAGVRAAVSDSLPIVGRPLSSQRVTIASGFEGDGICLCPLIGREVAAMVQGRAYDSALEALTPNRFLKQEASYA